MIVQDELSPWKTIQTTQENKNHPKNKNISQKRSKLIVDMPINRRTFKIKTMISKIFNKSIMIIPKEINLSIKQQNKEITTPKAKKKNHKIPNLKTSAINFNNPVNFCPIENISFLSVKPKKVMLDNFSMPNFHYKPCLLTKQILDGNFEQPRAKPLIYKV